MKTSFHTARGHRLRLQSRCLLLLVIALLGGVLDSAGQNRGAPPPAPPPQAAGPAPTARASAPIDLTGYWVSFITEDWRFRMVTPRKGDYQSVPMTPEARTIAEAWDPQADERAGNACKAYGAAAIMRLPGRLHVTWESDNALRIETDAGTQTRIMRFGPSTTTPGQRTWQGNSTALWERPTGRGAAPAAVNGNLKVVTTNLQAGYLRRNGVPYSQNAIVTEYFEVAPLPGGVQMMLVTTIVDDPQYLQLPFIVTSHFKKEPDGSKWDPTPCTAR